MILDRCYNGKDSQGRQQGNGTGAAGLRATEWWAERTNKAGGILGRPVQLVVEEESTPKDTVERYRKLVDLSPDAIAILDEEGRILFANVSMVRMVGAATDDQVVGHQVAEFILPDEREASRRRIATLMRGERVDWSEARWKRLDGRTIIVEVAGIPVRQGGKLVGTGHTGVGAFDHIGEGEFGASVALSADGKVVMAGAPRDGNRRGAVWAPKLTGSFSNGSDAQKCPAPGTTMWRT